MLETKYEFVANTSNKTVILGMDVRLHSGVNRWSANAIKQYITNDIEQKYNIVFLGEDPRKKIKKVKIENIIVPPVVEVEKSVEVNQEIQDEADALKLKAKSIEAEATFSVNRFSKLDEARATKQLSYITSIKKLNKVRAELEGFPKTEMHKKLIDQRIEELNK